MFAILRAGGRAAALLMLAALFAAPSTAADAQAARSPIAAAQTAPVASSPSVSLPSPAVAATPAPYVGSNSAAAAAPAPTALPVRPLSDLVIAFVDYGNQDAEQLCLAKAVYFEARGETLEGQLAVAEVVLNRAASGVYPGTICGVVTQRAQFSFVRAGRFPRVDTDSDCWRKALAIADIAQKKLARQIAPNVLWYHASYVAPAWKRNLTRFARIGTHIFYS